MSWQKVKLGQFLKNREGRYKPNDKAIQGLKRIDKINFSGTIFLSDKPSNTDMILVKKGDLVISGINVEKGAMNIYQGEEDVVATIHYSSYEFNKEKIDIDFLTNFLKSLEFKKALKEQVPGGIKTEIKPKHILPLLVEIPTDIKEQRKVVKKLIEDNSIIENVFSELTHQLDLIKQMRQAFLREAMQGKLVKSTNTKETGQQLLEKIKAEKTQLSSEKKLKKEKELPPINEIENPFEIPEHWVWCRLGSVITLISGQDLTPAEYNDTKNGVPYITGASHFKKDQLQVSRWTPTPKSISKINDLLITCKGTIGSMAYNKIGNIHIARQIMAIRNTFEISIDYVKYFLDLHSDELIKKAKSLIPGISRDDVLHSKIPFPPLHEQEQIVGKLKELMAFCDSLEQSIKESQGYNEMLLQQVLREALQPEIETKVVTLESPKLALPLKTILGAQIVDICNTTDFGRVKFQKLLFLTEYHCKIDFDSHYVQKTAGPHDDALIKSIEGEFKRQRFFEVKQENSDTHRVRYTKLPNASQINSMFLENFSDESLKVNNLLMKMRTFNWEECEVIATIYAVWNNRLLKGQVITDESLFEDFMAWSTRKSNFSKDFYKKLFWMKEENIVPDGNGWGSYVDKPNNKMA